MKKLQWTDDYSVNDDRIDGQHQHLFQLFNALTELVFDKNNPQKLLAIVDDLIDYTDFHFSEEESRMKAKNYPLLENHQSEHKTFVEQVTRYKKAIDDGDYDIVEDVFLYINKWLTMHIKIEDKKYIHYL